MRETIEKCPLFAGNRKVWSFLTDYYYRSPFREKIDCTGRDVGTYTHCHVESKALGILFNVNLAKPFLPSINIAQYERRRNVKLRKRHFFFSPDKSRPHHRRSLSYGYARKRSAIDTVVINILMRVRLKYSVFLIRARIRTIDIPRVCGWTQSVSRVNRCSNDGVTFFCGNENPFFTGSCYN